jgi:hypothetical protein
MNSSTAGNKNAVFNRYEIFQPPEESHVGLRDIKYSRAIRSAHETSSHF